MLIRHWLLRNTGSIIIVVDVAAVKCCRAETTKDVPSFTGQSSFYVHQVDNEDAQMQYKLRDSEKRSKYQNRYYALVCIDEITFRYRCGGGCCCCC
jgi:hypothetical protein